MSRSARLGLVLAFVPMVVLAGYRGLPAQGSSSPQIREDLALPADPLGGEIVHPYGRDVPEACTEFLQSAGGKWLLVWDRTLGTPRLAFPLSPISLFTSSGERLPLATGATPLEQAGQLARLFIAEHESFFGVTNEELNLTTTPFDGGYLVSGHQMQGGLPVRGTGFHLRLNGEFQLRSMSARVARDVVPVSGAVLSRDGANALAERTGLTLDADVPSVHQIAFPYGLSEPVPAWRVWGVDGEGEGVELLIDAGTEKILLSRRTALHFDTTIFGKLDGYCPDVEDVFAVPSEIYPEPQPVPEVFTATTATEEGTGKRFRDEEETDRDGIVAADFVNVDARAPYFIEFSMGKKDRFHYTADPTNAQDVLAHFIQFIAPGTFGTDRVERLFITFNESWTEHESFYLMAHHHMLLAYNGIRTTAARIDLVFDEPEASPRKGASLILHKRGFGYSYEPNRRRIIMRNDETQERDEDGRLRKIVPTIIHHEYAHHTITALTGSVGEVHLNEGISDALASFVAKTNKYAHHDRLNPRPTADPHARDLRNDRTSFPADPRRTVAGALRELFRETVDGVSEDDRKKPNFDEGATAGFTFEIVLKWLGSKRVQNGIGINALPFEFSPLIGWELMLAANPAELVQEPVGNNRTKLVLLKTAFGSRNLFPHPFLRGDSNSDSEIDIADALKTFNFLFLGDTEAPCLDAMDTDDSGDVDISDGIALLLYLFAGGDPPAAPGSSCGWDVTSGDGLGCISAPCTFLDP